jgi:hypothetical protein
VSYRLERTILSGSSTSTSTYVDSADVLGWWALALLSSSILDSLEWPAAEVGYLRYSL